MARKKAKTSGRGASGGVGRWRLAMVKAPEQDRIGNSSTINQPHLTGKPRVAGFFHAGFKKHVRGDRLFLDMPALRGNFKRRSKGGMATSPLSLRPAGSSLAQEDL
jgi:hypothetical protein